MTGEFFRETRARVPLLTVVAPVTTALGVADA
jgi:hypothetical protein